MKKGLEVFDFNEEDELPDLAAVAHSTAIQRKENNSVSCMDVDAVDCDRFPDDTIPSAPSSSREEVFASKEGISSLEVSSKSNPMSCKERGLVEKDNCEPRNSFPELESRDSCVEAPSPGKMQLNCAYDNSPSNVFLSNGHVDVASKANEGMSEESSSSSTSYEDEEDDESLNGNTSDLYFGNMDVDNLNRMVVVCPDYLLYQDNHCAGSLLVIFSNDGIKIKDSTLPESQGTFSFERGIDYITNIKCQWFQRAGCVNVKLRVVPEGVVEVENACGASGIEELKFTVADPNWSEKQKAITSLNGKYLAIWDNVIDQGTGMDGNDSLGRNPYFPNFDEPFEEVIYPKGDRDAISVSKIDVDMLQPETFINDTIIDFYIKYLENQIPSEERQRFHFFNSFFFQKLADNKDPSSISDGRAAFLRVRKWTRKVDIFGKDYIFIPVNFNLHWTLIVICHPGEVAGFKDEDLDKSLKIPCILHMDSIRGSHVGLKNLIQSYLWEEWKERHKETLEDLSLKFLNLRFVSLELPQQENSFDCGLFLLHYLELFLAEAPINFSPFKITKFSNFLNVDWFPPTEASLKRTSIQKLIFELLEPLYEETTSAEGHERQSSEFPEKDEHETDVEVLTNSCSAEAAYHGSLSNPQACPGIEITLLASTSMRNLQYANDSGVVLRELFDPEATAGSFLGQFQSFDPSSSYYPLNGAISPREQGDAETGDQFVYLASGESNFQQFTGIASQACALPYSSRGFAMDSSWNPGIAMQGQHDLDASSETFSASDDDDVGIIETSPVVENMDPSDEEKGYMQRSPSVENIDYVMNGIASAPNDVLGTCATEASDDPDNLHNSNEDENIVLLHQDPASSEALETCLAKVSEDPDKMKHINGDENLILLHQDPASVEMVETCATEVSEDHDYMQNSNEDEKLETCGTEVSEHDKMQNGHGDENLPSEENPSILLNQDPASNDEVLETTVTSQSAPLTVAEQIMTIYTGTNEVSMDLDEVQNSNENESSKENPVIMLNQDRASNEVIQATVIEVSEGLDKMPYSHEDLNRASEENPITFLNQEPVSNELRETSITEVSGGLDKMQNSNEDLYLPSEKNPSNLLHQDPVSNEVVKTSATEFSEDPHKMHDSKDESLPSEENPTLLLHEDRMDQDCEIVENTVAPCCDMQAIGGDVLADPDEQQAAKRIRLMPSAECKVDSQEA